MVPFLKGSLVEYERQADKPPVVAVVVSHHPDGTVTVSPRLVLDEDGSIMFENGEPYFNLEIDAALLKPARTNRTKDDAA